MTEASESKLDGGGEEEGGPEKVPPDVAEKVPQQFMPQSL